VPPDHDFSRSHHTHSKGWRSGNKRGPLSCSKQLKRNLAKGGNESRRKEEELERPRGKEGEKRGPLTGGNSLSKTLWGIVDNESSEVEAEGRREVSTRYTATPYKEKTTLATGRLLCGEKSLLKRDSRRIRAALGKREVWTSLRQAASRAKEKTLEREGRSCLPARSRGGAAKKSILL